MKPFPANKNTNEGFSLLPANIEQAMKFLITISEKMVHIGERETQLLVQGDLTSFTILQHEKESLATRYTRASKEFRSRLNEFRGADQNALNKLENLQRRLGEVTNSNRDIVERMFMRSRKKTHESLITVQELAQSHPINLGDDAATHKTHKGA